MFCCSRFEQKGQDGSSTLTISHVIEADTGDYECWAESKSSEVAQVKKKIKVENSFQGCCCLSQQ